MALADEESAVYAMATYGGSDCDSALGNPGNLIYSLSMGDRWVDAIDAWGTFEINQALENSTPEGEDFEDSSLDANGTDDQTSPNHEGVDTHDVVYVISHGTHTCSSPVYESVFAFPDSDATLSDDCSPSTDEDMYLGDTDLNMFYTTGCGSSHYCVWDNDGYDLMDSGSFALWAGFHGINTDGPGIPGAVTDFVSGTRIAGAGSHWISEMNHIRLFANDDDCATVVVWGANSTYTDNYYLNAGIEDFSVSVGSHSMNAIYYVDGCDPDDGVEL